MGPVKSAGLDPWDLLNQQHGSDGVAATTKRGSVIIKETSVIEVPRGCAVRTRDWIVPPIIQTKTITTKIAENDQNLLVILFTNSFCKNKFLVILFGHYLNTNISARNYCQHNLRR